MNHTFLGSFFFFFAIYETFCAPKICIPLNKEKKSIFYSDFCLIGPLRVSVCFDIIINLAKYF